MYVAADGAFGRYASGLLVGGRDTFFTKDLNCCRLVAVRFDKSVLAIDHSGSGLFTKSLYCTCCYFCHIRTPNYKKILQKGVADLAALAEKATPEKKCYLL